MFKAGDIVLTEVQFTDSIESKARPAIVLFEEFGNVIVAGVTSNTEMKGIPLTKNEGAIKESVIKINYIFTVSSNSIKRIFFHLSSEKKSIVFTELLKRLSELNK